MTFIVSTWLLGHEGSVWATSLTVGRKERGLEGGTERAQPSRAGRGDGLPNKTDPQKTMESSGAMASFGHSL